MVSKLVLGSVINEQLDAFFRKGVIMRDLHLPNAQSRVVIISGVRRCGKSTLLRQVPNDLANNALYINFEDPRLVDFELSDFPKVLEVMQEGSNDCLLLDEVQVVPQWELFARMVNDKGIPLYITGSNASMLSKELGTKLTGRYRQLELFPFSYNEYLRYTTQDSGQESFARYFEVGGFPEYIVDQANDYFGTLLRDIVTRDIAVRMKIGNPAQLVRLAVYLMSNVGKEVSYNNLSNVLEIKSVRTVIDHCDYLQESYLVEFVMIYSTSIKKQMVNPKKVYSIDPAFAQGNSLSLSKDLGRRLENFVFLHLRRHFATLHYYRNGKNECDFVVKDRDEIVLAVQVCHTVTGDNMHRELNGIKAAMIETGAPKAVIVTYDQEDNLEGIPLIPAWKWLLMPVA